jgi:putative acetyltransferase
MYIIKRTNSDDLDFQKLVVELDKDLAVSDGDEHSFYDQFNKLTDIKQVVVVYENENPVGCGAIKKYEKQITEVKRMYVQPNKRGKGIATLVLKELEAWAKELGYHKCILETGTKQPQAIALYKKNNFIVTDNYGQYTGVANSVCFEKKI